MVDAATMQSAVKGFLIPFYTDPVTGVHTFEDRESFEKVRLGYACASCLAEFHHYLAVCPVCGNARDVGRDLRETPSEWQSHYDEASGPGERTVARSTREAVSELTGSVEVEHIPISGLKPSKHGRGR